MTPGARVQALIELTEDVGRGGAADAAASSYFRARRYIGSKDRSWIADRLYAGLRRRARVDWWVNRVLERPAEAPPPASRHRVLADLVLTGDPAERVAGWFDGGPYRPEPPSRAERTLLAALDGKPLDHPDQPDWVRSEVPAWVQDLAPELFSDPEELAALATGAPLDLRVNPLVGTREDALAQLAMAGIVAEATNLSPLGLRVAGRPPLGREPAFTSGLVEVQDEGSQLVALLTDAQPGHAVIDFCAGAGGKTLALAASMQNRGRLIACDISAARLERAVVRLRRAGVHNVERRALDGESAGWLKRQAGRFDRVLVDAPCSGTGTWRRNPDMKWKLGPDDVAELSTVQASILARAAALVRPGGRLVYATCSLLAAENQAQVEGFLASHSAFRLLPMGEVWQATIGTSPPGDGPYLSLSPGRHGTDGFFTAVMERAPG